MTTVLIPPGRTRRCPVQRIRRVDGVTWVTVDITTYKDGQHPMPMTWRLEDLQKIQEVSMPELDVIDATHKRLADAHLEANNISLDIAPGDIRAEIKGDANFVKSQLASIGFEVKSITDQHRQNEGMVSLVLFIEAENNKPGADHPLIGQDVMVGDRRGRVIEASGMKGNTDRVHVQLADGTLTWQETKDVVVVEEAETVEETPEPATIEHEYIAFTSEYSRDGMTITPGAVGQVAVSKVTNVISATVKLSDADLVVPLDKVQDITKPSTFTEYMAYNTRVACSSLRRRGDEIKPGDRIQLSGKSIGEGAQVTVLKVGKTTTHKVELTVLKENAEQMIVSVEKDHQYRYYGRLPMEDMVTLGIEPGQELNPDMLLKERDALLIEREELRKQIEDMEAEREPATLSALHVIMSSHGSWNGKPGELQLVFIPGDEKDLPSSAAADALADDWKSSQEQPALVIMPQGYADQYRQGATVPQVMSQEALKLLFTGEAAFNESRDKRSNPEQS